MTVMLAIRNLTRRFPARRSLADLLRGRPRQAVHAVEQVSLDVHRGETLGIVGESGCGKSTLARCLVRLHTPDAGSLAFEGADVLALECPSRRAYNRRVQMVFQDPYSSLNPRLTVGETLAEALHVHAIVLKADILETVRANVEARGLEFTTQLLVALANERGGHDNITVQAARVVETRPRPTALPAASSATLLQSPAATTIGSNTLFEDADTSDWRRRPSPTIDAGHASVGATLRTAPVQPTWSATPPPAGTALGGPPTIGQAHGRTAFDGHKRRGLVYLVIGLALLVMALAVALLWSISNHHAP
jgi:ABC-type dipeptide/oligopeptide/nickel transport system ATPase subunit